jgi:hypothetical protein
MCKKLGINSITDIGAQIICTTNDMGKQYKMVNGEKEVSKKIFYAFCPNSYLNLKWIFPFKAFELCSFFNINKTLSFSCVIIVKTGIPAVPTTPL